MPFATTTIRDRQRARVRRLVQAGAPCHLCGRPIDLALTWPNPHSFSVDHDVPTTLGGADGIDNLLPAHLVCNQRRGNSATATGTTQTNSGLLG